MAARLLDRAAHGEEIAVQQEHHVIGQLVLRQLGEGAQVGEQDGDLALRPLLAARPRPRFGRPGRRRQQGHERDVAGGDRLAGEPHPSGRADAPEQGAFAFPGRRQRIEALRDMHPAGGAAPPPAADRGVWDAGGAAHLQQRGAGLGAHRAPVGIGDADRPLAPRPERADQPPRRKRGHRHACHGAHPRFDAFDPLDAGLPGEADPLQHGADPAGIRRGQRQDIAPADREARQRERGQQQRGREEQRQPPPVPGLEPQPEMHADASMRPGHGQERDLLRRIAPGRPEDEGIARVHAEPQREPERAEHMQAQQERNREAEKLLRRLPDRHPEVALAKEPRKRERAVDGEAAGEQRDAGRAAPNSRENAPPGLHCLHRGEAERVVQQVPRDIDEQDDAAPEPELLDHAAAHGFPMSPDAAAGRPASGSADRAPICPIIRAAARPPSQAHSAAGRGLV